MTLTRRLGIGALGLGLAAPFAGSPYRGARGQLDLEAVARAIIDGSDHVSALQLAMWIRERRPGLRVIDVRAPAAFAEYAIPTAENVPVERLADASFDPNETIVLYSDEGAHAGQAWVMLRALGVANAVFIPGGLADWRDEVMYPVLAPDASVEQRAAFTAASEVSRYFGGAPRIGEAIEAAPRAQPAMRRRGC